MCRRRIPRRLALLATFSALMFLSWAPWAGSLVHAGTPPAPPGPTKPAGSGRKDHRPEPAAARLDSYAPSASSDNFGYAVDDSVAYQWIDTTAGTKVNFPGADDSSVGPVNLGFSFPFYENTFSAIYIGTNGVLTFKDEASGFSNVPIPLDAPPNDLIAVFWDDLVVGGSFNAGEVYYRKGTQSGKKYFAVGWEGVTRLASSDLLTFEAVLYENGDIKLQYKDLNGTLDQSTVGIEDGDGVDGLLYLHHSSGLSAGLAVAFNRPAKDYRVKLMPVQGSGLVVKGHAQFDLVVRNTGEKGSDTYDLTITPASATWQVAFLNGSGTPLGDSNLNGKPDTGSLAQSGVFTVTVDVQPPATAQAGDYYSVQVTARSNGNSSKAVSSNLTAAIPVPFAQAFADGVMGMNLDLVWEHKWNTAPVMAGFSGSSLAIAPGPEDQFVYAWERNGIGSGGLFTNIEYAQLNAYGEVVQSARTLVDNSGDSYQTTDRFPALAVAPDGRIGVLWVRDRLNLGTLKTNSNVYFAVLDTAGSIQVGPVNMTNNTAWRGEGDLNLPTYTSPRLAATEDNRFVIAWVDGRLKSGGEISDIVYAVRDTGGGVIKSPGSLTSSAPGGNRYLDPSLTDLSGARVLLAYAILASDDITYRVAYRGLGSDGTPLTSEKVVSGLTGWGPDAVQLPAGPVLLAWTDPTTDQVAFLVLYGTSLAKKAGPTSLPNPDGRAADFVSVAYSGSDRGVLTWMDSVWNERLYFAVVAGDGTQRTPPLMFREGSQAGTLLLSSYAGQGNAPFSGAWRNVYLPLTQR